MLSPLICGTFQDQEDEDFELLRSCTSPKSRKPARWHSFGVRSNKGNKNPYADRGLDKFSALLAELDSKRQKIYTQKGSEDISLLGFAYSNSDDYKPIVVKLKNKKKPVISSEKEKPKNTNDLISTTTSPHASSAIELAKDVQVNAVSRLVSNIKVSPKKVSFDLLKNIKLEKLKQPSYYLSLIIILILVLLIVFGKSFTILCTTLGWYFIPTIQSLDFKTTKAKTKKKDYVKALSYNNKSDHEISNVKKTKTMNKALSYNNKFVKSGTPDHGLSSPRSVLNGYKSPPQPASPPQQDHRRSSPRQVN